MSIVTDFLLWTVELNASVMVTATCTFCSPRFGMAPGACASRGGTTPGLGVGCCCGIIDGAATGTPTPGAGGVVARGGACWAGRDGGACCANGVDARSTVK